MFGVVAVILVVLAIVFFALINGGSGTSQNELKIVNIGYDGNLSRPEEKYSKLVRGLCYSTSEEIACTESVTNKNSLNFTFILDDSIDERAVNLRGVLFENRSLTCSMESKENHRFFVGCKPKIVFDYWTHAEFDVHIEYSYVKNPQNVYVLKLKIVNN